VHYPARVAVLETPHNLAEEPTRFLIAEPALLPHVSAQITPAAELHDQVLAGGNIDDLGKERNEKAKKPVNLHAQGAPSSVCVRACVRACVFSITMCAEIALNP
jgi:hypothetical protein